MRGEAALARACGADGCSMPTYRVRFSTTSQATTMVKSAHRGPPAGANRWTAGRSPSISVRMSFSPMATGSTRMRSSCPVWDKNIGWDGFTYMKGFTKVADFTVDQHLSEPNPRQAFIYAIDR